MKIDKAIPVVKGSHGMAWECDVDAIMEALGFRPATSACIGQWIVAAPWAHPFWDNYIISVIHLRPIPGAEPPVILLPGATHEIYVIALDPNHEPDTADIPRTLTPINFAAQFIAQHDVEARARVLRSVEEICKGELNPDTDYIREWVRRYSDSNIKKGEQIV
jgi:hypothetical protein